MSITNNEKIIQGLISLEVKMDHVFMHLVESAPFNKGKSNLTIMKKKDIELDVDFIGTQDTSLTKEEEKKISEYIKKHKVKLKKSSKRPQGI